MTLKQEKEEILRKEHLDPFHYPGHEAMPTSKDCPLCLKQAKRKAHKYKSVLHCAVCFKKFMKREWKKVGKYA